MRFALIAAILLLAGCRQAREIPPLPAVDTAGFAPTVRGAIDGALATARMQPDDAAVCGRLAMTLHAHDLFDAAAVSYARARALKPNEFRWTYLQGSASMSQGRREQALPLLREAVRLNPASAAARIALAEAADTEEAAVQYRAATGLDPSPAVAWAGLARTAQAAGNTDDAIRLYLRAIEIAPAYGAAHYGLSRLYQARGDASAAGVHAAAAEQHGRDSRPATDDPDLAAMRALHAGAFQSVSRGVALFGEGRLEEAAREFESALRADPRETAARYNLITIYGQLERFDEAARHYEEGARNDPASAETHFNYGVVQARRNRAAEAAELFRKTLALNPHYAEAEMNLGYLAEATGQTREAMARYRRALEIAPDLRQAHFRLARLLLARGSPSSARGHFEEAAAGDDADAAQALYGLAICQRALADAGANASAQRAHNLAIASGLGDLAAAIVSDFPAVERK